MLEGYSEDVLLGGTVWLGAKLNLHTPHFHSLGGGMGSEKMGCRELGTHVGEYFSKTQDVMEDSGSGV